MFDSEVSVSLCSLETQVAALDDKPSIMYSFTISQSCFMWYSERYLQFFAASSHSLGPADRLRRAGPGTGTLIAPMVVVKGRCVWEGRRGWRWRKCPTDLLAHAEDILAPEGTAGNEQGQRR